MSAYMEMARPAPLSPASLPALHGYDAAGNGVCFSPTLVHNGYHAQTDDAHAFEAHPDAPYHMVVVDGSDDDGDYYYDNEANLGYGDADEYGRPRVAHAPGVGGHYWSPAGQNATAAGAAAASSEAVGRQIATMLESLAGLDSGIATAAAAMFVPTVIVDDGERAQAAAEASASRVSHMRMAGTSYTPDPMVTRGRVPVHKSAAPVSAPAETESGGETYVVERTTNVYYDDGDDDDDEDDDRDNDRQRARRRVVHGDAYAYPTAVRRRQHDNNNNKEAHNAPSTAQTQDSSSSSLTASSSSSSSSSSGSSSSSFFSSTTFGSSSTQPTTTCASDSSSSSSSSSSDTSDRRRDTRRPRRQRKRDPCSPSSGDTVSISSISAPWASAFSTVSSAASTTSRLSSSTDTTSSDSALTIPRRRNKRRAHARKRAYDSTTTDDDSMATDIEEFGRRAGRLVQLARSAQDTDGDTNDGDTVDPHAVASRARHNRRR
ncbi:hypothetical protein pqer_cds_227 [Pandoravirus quercus]|uniref:Uncharacterized protein n=1 Tax=Pandoravirus quercus TaxID=2107709 RepID=A0A2U7U897_9VIRU|nr:hypothetical protein pqer_cds_227 [Pandoravirus quercus]AVK74649.1 hypothetical protein pqer_cds_227 [Pandoravirus quercus]